MWKAILGGIGLGVLAVVFVVVLVIVAAIGGVAWFFLDPAPLLYYDARPAYVDDPGLEATGYKTLNSTDFTLGYAPITGGKEVQMRTWTTVYVSGVEGPERDAVSGNTSGNASVDIANASVVTVFSMSSLGLGPVHLNPLVYATDPGLLNESGILLDQAETYLPSNVTNVTDVSIRSERRITMLGQETGMTTLDGTLELSNETTIDVRLYVARVVHEGELVIAFGIAPQNRDVADHNFGTLVYNLRQAEWGERGPEGEFDIPELDPDFSEFNESTGAPAIPRAGR